MRNLLAIVDQWFDDSPGGAARVAADHARAAAEHGWEVTVATVARSTERAGLVQFDGVRLLRLPVPDGARGFARLRAFQHQLSRAVAEQSWDLVHLHNVPLGHAALGVVAEETPTMVTVHSPITDEMRINWSQGGRGDTVRRGLGLPLLKRMEARVLQQADTVHVLSEFTRSRLLELHGQAGATLVPHWVPDEHLSRSAETTSEECRLRLGWPTDLRVLFSLRGHKARTGLEDLIDAAAPILLGKAAHLVIAGRGPLSSALQERVQRLGIARAVSFPGWLSDADLDMSYRAADLFVLPTRYLECFGLVTIEALARGLPVLASDAGATPEILGQMLPGHLYPAGDVGILRSRLERFLSGDLRSPSPADLRGALGRRYGRSVVVPELLELFDRSASAGHSYA